MNPGVNSAIVSGSTSVARTAFFMWTSRMAVLPFLSGRSTRTWRSKRPARRSAGSKISGRLVAASKMTRGWIESIQFDQKLVQRLLLLRVTSIWIRSASAAERVKLVDEDDRRSLLGGLFEQVAYARGADPHEHFDEFRS